MVVFCLIWSDLKVTLLDLMLAASLEVNTTHHHRVAQAAHIPIVLEPIQYCSRSIRKPFTLKSNRLIKNEDQTSTFLSVIEHGRSQPHNLTLTLADPEDIRLNEQEGKLPFK